MGNAYRFGFNGKELDKEGMGGGASTYDYGFRIYNSALGKFLSIDPVSASFPELSAFQYASNTPIWAIDLDGAEAVVVQLSTRVTFIIVSGQVGIGMAICGNSISLYITPEGGLGAGVSFGGGVTASYYPTATNSEQFKGWGMNIGFSVMGNGGDASSCISSEGVGATGGSASVPKIGAGAGGEGHWTFGYSYLIATFDCKEELEKLVEYTKALGLTEEKTMELVNNGKEVLNDLNSANNPSNTEDKNVTKTPVEKTDAKNSDSNVPAKKSHELQERLNAQPEFQQLSKEKASEFVKA